MERQLDMDSFRNAALPVLLCACALAGCDSARQQAAEPAETNAAVEGSVSSSAPKTESTTAVPIANAESLTYTCDNGQTIVAIHHQRGADGGVDLAIGGKSYELRHVPSGSGAKYTTEVGLKPDWLLEWWSEGDQATLGQSPLDDSAGAEDFETLAKCRVRGVDANK